MSESAPELTPMQRRRARKVAKRAKAAFEACLSGVEGAVATGDGAQAKAFAEAADVMSKLVVEIVRTGAI